MYSAYAYSEAAYSEDIEAASQLAGAAAAVATATGDLSTGIQLAGDAAAVATAAGTLGDSATFIEGDAAAVATAAGDLTIEKPLEGAAAGQATAAGDLSTGIQLDGDATGQATAAGDLSTGIQLEGDATGQATAAGDITTGIQMAGDATGQAAATGEINFYRPLFGDAAAVATAAGTLTEPAPPAKTFILGGISVPFESHLDLNQDYHEHQASRITRHCDGSARKQTAWSGKTVIRTSGHGWYPPGFDLLDYDTSMEMSCIALRAITSASNTITIPAARRTDQGFEPLASATVNGGKRDATITGISGNVVTVAAVSGAAFYTVYYYPKLTVFASLPVIRHDAINDQYSWQMEAREV